jgi:hypothetical protein
MQPISKRSTSLGRRAAAPVLLAVALVAGSCGGRGEQTSEDPSAPRPVSGRVDTGAGISIDFPDGWAQMPTAGLTFTRYYENAERQLALGINDFATSGESIWTMGEQVKRRLSHEATVEESGPLRVDGREAFRVVSALKTSTGHGRVVGIVLLRTPNRASSLFLSTKGNEREDHREEMDALLETVRVT